MSLAEQVAAFQAGPRSSMAQQPALPQELTLAVVRPAPSRARDLRPLNAVDYWRAPEMTEVMVNADMRTL